MAFVFLRSKLVLRGMYFLVKPVGCRFNEIQTQCYHSLWTGRTGLLLTLLPVPGVKERASSFLVREKYSLTSRVSVWGDHNEKRKAATELQ